MSGRPVCAVASPLPRSGTSITMLLVASLQPLPFLFNHDPTYLPSPDKDHSVVFLATLVEVANRFSMPWTTRVTCSSTCCRHVTFTATPRSNSHTHCFQTENYRASFLVVLCIVMLSCRRTESDLGVLRTSSCSTDYYYR